jgi:hypothetical protein
MDHDMYNLMETNEHMTLTEDSSKGKFFVWLVILGFIVAAVVCYILFWSQPDTGAISGSTPMHDSLRQSSKDTILMKQGAIDDEEGVEDRYIENYIVEPLMVDGTSFRFGDPIYLDNQLSTEEVSVFYRNDPRSPAGDRKVYRTQSLTAVPGHQFDTYRNSFSLPPFTELDFKVKKLLLSEDYSAGITYRITQNSARAGSTISSGDFDADGKQDFAVVMDNDQMQCSRLLIIGTNEVTEERYIAFAENYADKIQIQTFKKGSKIIMNGNELEESAHDGIMVTGEDVKLAICYDRQLQKFKIYYQE